MSPIELSEGDVVQLSPTKCRNQMFGACFMIVTEPKSFGAQGYVQMPGSNGAIGGAAFYRAHWDETEYIGRAEWVRA